MCVCVCVCVYIKTLEQQYDHLTPALQIIQVRQARYCLGIKDKLISNILLLIPKHEHNDSKNLLSSALCEHCIQYNDLIKNNI